MQNTFSFDIINLFSSTDIKEINQTVNEEIGKIYHDRDIKQTMTKTGNLIMNKNNFHLNNVIYNQKEGVSMGGILTEFKLRKLKEIIKIKFKNSMRLRCVDDIFAIIEKDTGETRMLEELNTIDKKIKFTLETEKSKAVNYVES